MDTRPIALISLLALSFLAPAQPPAESGEQIAACMRDNLPERFWVEDFVLTSRAASGDAEAISGQLYFTRQTRDGQTGPSRAMLRIENPSPLRNAAYLILESEDYLRDGMFVFLPAVNRVRRVSGSMADGQLFGTDISYYDFKQFRSALSDMRAGQAVAVQHENRPAWSLRFDPAADEEAGYERVDAVIDAQTCVPRVLEIYENGRLRKTFTVPLDAIKPYADGRWYIAEFSMHDHLKDSDTTIRTLGFDTSRSLPEQLFHPSTFYRAY